MDDLLQPRLCTEEIREADSVERLRVLRDQIHKQSDVFLPERPLEQWNGHLNEAHDAIIARAIMLAEQQLARQGIGSPPVPYAYLLFGSGGRKEQTLASDQDSGLVYGDPAGGCEAEAAAYFSQLSGLIVAYLMEAGYPPCDGKVQSDNPLWSGALRAWENRLAEWFREPLFESVRNLLIFADGRCVYGDERLLAALKDVYFAEMERQPAIQGRMVDNTMRHKVLVGIFGQLLTERYGEDSGTVDIKYGAYIPMVNAARMMAVQAGIRFVSTLERLRGLVERGKLSVEEGRNYERAFLFILKLRMMAKEQVENGLYSNTGKLQSDKLTKEMRDELKASLRQGKRMQRAVSRQGTTG